MMRAVRYLIVFSACLVSLFGGTWWLTLHERSGFLEPEYGVWRAKLRLIDSCDLGDIIILGDSRASSGFLPSRFNARVTNLALSGTGPIEAYYEVQRIAHCLSLPRLAILSFSPEQLEHVDWFWARSARFDLLSYDDLEDIRASEQRVSPGLLYHSAWGVEPPGAVLDWFYVNHFPPYDFGNLLASGVLGRLGANRRTLEETYAERGYHAVPGHYKCAKDDPIPEESEFRPLSLVDRYYERLLKALHDRAIAIVIAQGPQCAPWAEKVTPQFKREFAAYMSKRGADRYITPSVDELFPVRPNEDFGDGSHMNATGARSFSDAWARRLDVPLSGYNVAIRSD